ncbi:hypothetical protein MNBD_GAMMA02-1118, partial [hydrothermal vent metagenome]
MKSKRKLTPSSLVLIVLFSMLINTSAMAQIEQQRKLFKTLYSLALQGKEQAVKTRRQPLDNFPINHY